MVVIGNYNTLQATTEVAGGMYLDAGDYGELLLRADQVPAGARPGGAITVFLYSDAEGRIVPTTKKPTACVGECACLTVLDVAPIGAFLDWGLPKDLFVPRSEQYEPMEKGKVYVVYVYADEKRKRIAASSKLEAFLDTTPARFKDNDPVELLIYARTAIGYKVAINNTHTGLLYETEVFAPLAYGQRVDGFIKKMRADGKIDVSLQAQGYGKMDALEEAIIARIQKSGGLLTVTDTTPPEEIYAAFGVSKKKYKMALGALYKARRITIADAGISLVL